MPGQSSSPSEDPPRSRPEPDQLLGREDAAAAGLTAGDALELAQLLERVDADVRVGSDAERDRPVPDALGREEPVAEVCLGRRAGADRRAGRGKEVELGAVRVRRVDHGRALAEAAGAREQLDGAASMLGEALLDLARLLVRVHVQWKPVLVAVAADLLEPVEWARAHGVGGEPDPDPSIAKLLDLAQVLRDRLLAKARKAAACVRDVQQDDGDARGLGCLGGGECLREPEVVEFADCRVARRAHFAVRLLVRRTDEVGRLALRLGEHRVAPGPEVATRRPAPESTLERVTVSVHEPG